MIMNNDYVVFLKNLNISVNNPTFCNDSCNCQWDNWESTLVEKGDEYLWYRVCLDGLVEDEDYKYCI